MGKAPLITRVEIHEFFHEVRNLGTDYNGFNSVYELGARARRTRYALRIGTDAGVTGAYVGGGPSEAGEIRMYASYLLGRSALEREKIYNDVKRALRSTTR